MYNLLSAVSVTALVSSTVVLGNPIVWRDEPLQNVTNSTTQVSLDINVNGGGRNNTSPILYGWMIEDISHSVDGGLYAEMIMNRAFQGSSAVIDAVDGIPLNHIVSSENPILPFGPVINGWEPIGDTLLSLDRLHPLSDALPTVMQVDILDTATGEVGFLNTGWWGMQVSPQTYNASFYILKNTARENTTLSEITVSLRSNLTGEVWASTSIPVSANGTISDFYWTQLSAQIVNNATAPNSNNTFAITFDAAEVAGCTFFFDLISLFPETFAGRANGIRKDIGEHIYNMHPKMLRFPGGNNLEGYSTAQRWKWNETIGPLKDRPGRVGNWGYYNTDGFGLMEYLEWTEDMGLERILAVYSGFSLDVAGQVGTSYPEDQMAEVLQEALDEIEFCMGDTSTKYGALRAEYGHPEPFSISYVELGNEDFFSTTYGYRLPYMYNGIKAVYPSITLIATAADENSAYEIDIPPGGMTDLHDYSYPSFFIDNFDRFDNWNERTGYENVTVFLGEYSVFQLEVGAFNFTARLQEPELISALAESVYLLGAERNPNTVKMSSYAPSFQNFNSPNWTPDLIGMDAFYNDTVLTTSYYSQQLLAAYRGTQTLPITFTEGSFDPLYFVSTIDEDASIIYFKVVNAGDAAVPLSIDFDVSWTSVNGTILTSGSIYDANTRDTPSLVVPQTIDDLPSSGTNGTGFEWDVPAYSINVLQFAI